MWENSGERRGAWPGSSGALREREDEECNTGALSAEEERRTA